MPAALVTGAAGQDGGYLCEELLAQGWEVHGLVRSGDAETAAGQQWLRGVELHTVDIADGAQLRQVVADTSPHTVFHLAALSSVGMSWEQPVLTAQVNAVAVAQLLDAAWEHQQRTGAEVRVLQASSAEIFGPSAAVPQDESGALRPVNPYGAAKAYAHHLVDVYRRRGLFATACILYNHESPRRPEAFVTRKITAAAARIAAGRQDGLSLGDLSIRRDWGWAPDYAHAMVLAAGHSEPTDFVVATGEDHSIEDFVEAAFTRVGLDWTAHVSSDAGLRRPTDSAVQVGCADKARSVLGWSPTKDFRGLVEAMVDADVRSLAGG